MPGQRSKNDTWTEGDLLKAIQGDPSSSKKSRSSQEKSTKRERDHSRSRPEKNKDEKKKEKERSSSKHRSKDVASTNDKPRSKDRSEKSSDSKHRTRDRNEEQKTGSSKEKHKTRSEEQHRSKDREKEKVRKESSRENQHIEKESSRKHKDEKKKDSKSEKHSRSSKKEKDRTSGSSDSKHRSSEEKISKHGKDKKRERSRKDDSDKKQSSKDNEKESIKNKEEKEDKTKVKTNDDDYNYDDEEFDDYDDDFEDDFENDSDNNEEKGVESDHENNVSHDASDDDGVKGSDNESIEGEGIVPQKSMFHLTPSEEQGVEEVLKAITAENDKLSSSIFTIKRSSSSHRQDVGMNKEADVEEKKPPKKVHGKINFMAASQKQINEKVARRNKQRGEELLKLIQLDVRSIDLFDMPPMTEYELYMKRFGQSNCKQMFTQTNEDDVEQEVQTDEIKTESRWCQHTEDMRVAGVSVDGETSIDSTDKSESFIPLNSRRLNRFLINASKVCCSLLEELEAGIELPQRQYTDSRTSFSDGYVTLTASDFVVLGRNFTSMAYSLDETNMLMTSYGSSNVTDVSRKIRNGIICVWNTNEPTRPHKLLVCESTPNSCCFITGTASIVFAGMNDGTVALWDLNEPDSFHEAIKIGRSNHVFHSAAFTTAGLRGNHESPIISVTPLSTMKRREYGQQVNKTDMSFQLASLDQSGLIVIWIIVEVNDIADDFSNLQDDLGLSSRGRMKLVKSGTIAVSPTSKVSWDTSLITSCLQIDPIKANSFYIGTQQGMVMHKVRFGKRPSPKAYDHLEGYSSIVTSIDISLFDMPLLLVSYENGAVSLFHLNKETPLITWSDFSYNSRVTDVKWSRSLPNVFYAINEQSMFYAWDLLESDEGPAFEQKISRKDKRAIGFTLANDYSSLGRGIPSRSPEMALIYGDGSVEVHRISGRLSNMNGNEIDEMIDYIDNLL